MHLWSDSRVWLPCWLNRRADMASFANATSRKSLTQDNPNLDILQALKKAGVTPLVCGQMLAEGGCGHGYRPQRARCVVRAHGPDSGAAGLRLDAALGHHGHVRGLRAIATHLRRACGDEADHRQR